MAKAAKQKPAEKRDVTREIDVDCGRLFGVSLEQAAAYLREVQAANPGKSLCLVEKWYGYEDNGFVFSYDEIETDEEFAERLAVEQAKRERERRAAEAALERKRDEAELSRLKRKLGVA